MIVPVKQLLSQILQLKPEDQKRYADQMLALLPAFDGQPSASLSRVNMKKDMERFRQTNAKKGFTAEELQAWREATRF